VLTAQPDPSTPARFDEEIDSMPTGTNTNFQGGDIRSDGTNTTGPAYNSRPGGQPGGTPGGTGTAPPTAARAEDLSERPRIECDENALREFYPDEARDEGISEEAVSLRLTVDASGRITEARASSDPGHGFGRAAERALRNACTATVPRNRDGQAVTAQVTFRIRFRLD
jgi:protein TonB